MKRMLLTYRDLKAADDPHAYFPPTSGAVLMANCQSYITQFTQ